MKKIVFIVCFGVLLAGCKKKDEPAPEPEPIVEPVSPGPPAIACEPLPPPPQPFGWRDSTLNVEENITAFIFNPVNPDEIICVAEGNINGYNQLFTINLISRKKTALGNIGVFLPSINKKGWIVYSSIDNNIFKVKANGDSLQQVTFNYSSVDPKWDPTGIAIFYFQQATGSVQSSLVKVNLNGVSNISLIPADLPHHAPFRKSDKVIYLKTTNSFVTLIQRDMVTQQEKELITGSFDQKTSALDFNHLTLDNNDENIYWSNAKGLFRCNLATLKTDTLLKNCPNYSYINPLISLKDNELTVSQHIVKPVSSFILFHQYKTMQMNLLTRSLTELRIFQ